MKFRAIKTKCGRIFAACTSETVDKEWTDQEEYYVRQGCEAFDTDDFSFGVDECNCDDCSSLLHDFDTEDKYEDDDYEEY